MENLYGIILKLKKKQITTPNVINEYRRRVSRKDLNFNKTGTRASARGLVLEVDAAVS